MEMFPHLKRLCFSRLFLEVGWNKQRSEQVVRTSQSGPRAGGPPTTY